MTATTFGVVISSEPLYAVILSEVAARFFLASRSSGRAATQSKDLSRFGK